MNRHTVEKIGGTSMSRFDEVMNNVLIGGRAQGALYNRIFVVSAFGGITDMLLENKRTGEPGVYSLFCSADTDWEWSNLITRVGERMSTINAEMFQDEMDLQVADAFVKERLEGVRSCLLDLHRLCSFGHFQLEEHLATVREMLSAVGEAHSAHNTALALRRQGVNSRFVDLTGWRDPEVLPLQERIASSLSGIDLSRELPIVTGYAQCKEGLISQFDRGYSEITFSQIAVVSGASEAIIHKEYHLSSADPRIVGEDEVCPIGRTNYDVADQLSNLGMEAIHPGAAIKLRQRGIPLRVRNTFEPHHSGTLIDSEYCSESPQVEIVAGRKNVYLISLFDQDMVGQIEVYDAKVIETVRRFGVKVISQHNNANTLTRLVSGNLKAVKRITHTLESHYPGARIRVRKVALVAAIGSDLSQPGLLARTLQALADRNVEVLAVHTSTRWVDVQLILDESQYEEAIRALHSALIQQQAPAGHSEPNPTGRVAVG